MGGARIFAAGNFAFVSPYSMVNWVWSNGERTFVYKLFPDVVAFYAFIVGIVVLSVLAHRYEGVRRVLHKRVWVSCCLVGHSLIRIRRHRGRCLRGC